MFLILLVQSALAGSVCADGWVSSSSGSGTCSHHGGVAGSVPYSPGLPTQNYFLPDPVQAAAELVARWERERHTPALQALSNCKVDRNLNTVGVKLDCPAYTVEVIQVLKSHKWIMWTPLGSVQDVSTDTTIFNSTCIPASNDEGEEEIVCGYVDLVYDKKMNVFTIGDINDLVQPHVKLRAIPKNTDGDRLLDIDDHCPHDLEDEDNFKDDDGCPDPDNDADSILDVNDLCVEAAEDRDDFADDDGCPDLDNDKDGISDKRDHCPNEREDRDNFKDDDGCFESDNDEDGIIDETDLCPNTPENVDGTNDDDGCPEAEIVKLSSGKYPADKKTISDLKQAGCFVRMAEELGFVKASCPK